MKYSPVPVIVVCLVFLSLCVCSLETFTNECLNGPIGLISTVATHEVLQYVSLKGLDFKHLEREGRLDVFVCDTEEQERILSLISKNQFDSSKTHFKKAQPGKLLFEKNSNPTSLLPDGYSDLDAIWEHLESAASQYPDLVSIVNTSIYGPGATYEGRLLPIVKVSVNVQEDEDEPNILILSAHHSREIVTPQLALSTLDELLSAFNQKSHPQHSKIVTLLNSSEIFIAPIWNPDGYDYVWNSNNMWRKNRKPRFVCLFVCFPQILGSTKNLKQQLIIALDLLMGLIKIGTIMLVEFHYSSILLIFSAFLLYSFLLSFSFFSFFFSLI